MSVEALVLAIASALRPSTSTAAVYALLSSERPRPPLAAFTLGGLVVSCTFGVVVVSALHGVSLPGHESTRNAIIELVAGAAMIGFAAGSWSGHVHRLRPRRGAERPGRIVATLRRPTLKVSAVAGAATHLPGLFYLVALNSIAAGSPPLPEAIVAVLIYNAIWFSVPIAAFAVAGRHADAAHAKIAQINAWAREREQTLVVVVFAGVGAYLVVKGIVALAS